MKRVIIEQDAALNQHLSLPPPKTKAEIRQSAVTLAAFILPFFCLTLLVGIFNEWSEDKAIELSSLIAIVATPFTIIICWVTLSLRYSESNLRNSKRCLHLSRSGVDLIPETRIAWKNLLGWHLEPVSSESQLHRLTLVHCSFGNRNITKHSSIIFSQEFQIEAFQSYLDLRKQSGKEVPARLAELPEASQPQTMVRQLHPLGWMLVATALCLFMPAALAILAAIHFLRMPVLLFSAKALDANSRNLETFALTHFTSSHEMGWIIICASLLLILASVALNMIGQRLIGGATTNDPQST